MFVIRAFHSEALRLKFPPDVFDVSHEKYAGRGSGSGSGSESVVKEPETVTDLSTPEVGVDE
jgi:hypothetical protein